MNALYVQVSAMAGASGDSLLGDAKNQVAAAASRVALSAERQPPVVQGLVKNVVNSTTSSMMGSVRNQLNAAWISDVVSVYRQSLAGRYPIAAGSSRRRHPGRLRPLLRCRRGDGQLLPASTCNPTSTPPPAPGAGSPARRRSSASSPGVLHTFQRAAAIRDAFFRSGGMQPTVRFELKPVTMDAAISQFILDLDGQQLTTTTAPAAQWRCSGRAPTASALVRLTVTPPPSSGRSGLTLEGPWAWFRLLDQSDLERGNSPDRFTLRLRIDGSSIACERAPAAPSTPSRAGSCPASASRAPLNSVGFYGKLAGRGDFVSRGLPNYLRRTLGRLAGQRHARQPGRARRGLARRLPDQPAVALRHRPGLLGGEAVTGVVMPSIDRVGRYFPLTVACLLPANADLGGLVGGDDGWFERVEACCSPPSNRRPRSRPSSRRWRSSRHRPADRASNNR
ncbi:type VI secretion system-associated protein TagF [Pseudomonas aeruginosa]